MNDWIDPSILDDADEEDALPCSRCGLQHPDYWRGPVDELWDELLAPYRPIDVDSDGGRRVFDQLRSENEARFDALTEADEASVVEQDEALGQWMESAAMFGAPICWGCLTTKERNQIQLPFVASVLEGEAIYKERGEEYPEPELLEKAHDLLHRADVLRKLEWGEFDEPASGETS
jgi:hypothetical protein